MTERHQLKRRIMESFVIKELSAVDRPAQKGATAVLMKRADEQENDMQFHKISGDDVASFDTLESAMAHLRKAHGLTPLAAMEKAADQYPELVKRYNAEGEEIAKAAVTRIPTTPAAVVRFDDLVEQVMVRDGVNKLIAMEQAQREFPREFEAYQATAATPSDLGLRPAGAVAM